MTNTGGTTGAVVLNVSNHPIDLDDGRDIGPGDWAENVNTGEAHNARNITEGLLLVLPGVPKDSPRQTDGGDQAGGSSASSAVASAPSDSSAAAESAPGKSAEARG